MISISPLKNHRCIRNYYINHHKTQLKYMCDLDKICNCIWDRVLSSEFILRNVYQGPEASARRKAAHGPAREESVVQEGWLRGCRHRREQTLRFLTAKGTNSTRAQPAAGGPSAATWIVLGHRQQVPRENLPPQLLKDPLHLQGSRPCLPSPPLPGMPTRGPVRQPPGQQSRALLGQAGDPESCWARTPAPPLAPFYSTWPS